MTSMSAIALPPSSPLIRLILDSTHYHLAFLVLFHRISIDFQSRFIGLNIYLFICLFPKFYLFFFWGILASMRIDFFFDDNQEGKNEPFWALEEKLFSLFLY